MKPQAGRKPSLYEQLMALPEGLTGEIINGQLRTQPRPAWPHILAGSRLGADIEGAYGRGRGGPGGWWIIDDREEKMPLYANHGVRFAWLVDPKTRTLEAYELKDAKWTVINVFRDDDMVSVAPFDAIVIRLSDLWG